MSPERIRALPILELEGRNSALGWSEWLAAADLPAEPPRAAARFRSYAFLLEACREGAGVALGWRHLVDDLLDRGVLLRLGTVEIASEAGLQAVHRADADPLVAAAVAALREVAAVATATHL